MGKTYVQTLLERNIPEKPINKNGIECCPNCDEYIHTKQSSTDPINTYKFCPNCGKKLERKR